MIPKPKAENEAGLRPIGLRPYIYRVWMAIRKDQDAQQQWSLDIHDGRHAGATTLAARTRASLQVAGHQGQHTLLAFLVCSKCYERVGHANVVFDMYKGSKHIRAHGAVAQPRSGHHGSVAGCAFARDRLKSFIGPLQRECPNGRPRDYIVDLMPQVQGGTPQGCVAQMHAQLEKLKGALRRDNMARHQGCNSFGVNHYGCV